MLCFFCDQPGRCICHYCGRALCFKHLNKGPENLIKDADKANFFHEKGYLTQSIWCGQCATDNTMVLLERKLYKSSDRAIKETHSNNTPYLETRNVRPIDTNIFSDNTKDITDEIHPDIKTELCPQCQKNISEEDSFCPFCGYELFTIDNKILATCPNCGYYDINLLNEVFCPKCKAPLPI